MIYINRFVDKISTANAKQLKKFEMSLSEAKGLHSDITKLLLVLQELQTPAPKTKENKVEIDGGDF